MRPLLHKCEIPSFRGWKETIEKIQKQIQEGQDYSVQIDSLKSLYSDHLLVGEKAVKIFRVDIDRMNKLCSSLSVLTPESNVYSERYPFPLEQDALEEIGSEMRVAKIRTVGANMAVIFCKKKNVLQKIKLEAGEVDSDLLKEYDEIVAKKEHAKQFFDVVFLRQDRGIAEIRIDIEEGMSSDDRSISFEEVERSFNEMYRNVTGDEGIFLSRAVNVFPVIDSLYKSQEGIVTDIYFKTSEGATKNAHMKKGGKGLREEMYHKAGTEKLEREGLGIDLYRMHIRWRAVAVNDLTFQPNLTLPGKIAELSNLTPVLEEFIILGCGVMDNYESIFEKVYTRL